MTEKICHGQHINHGEHCTQQESSWEKELDTVLIKAIMESKPTVKHFPLGILEKYLKAFISTQIELARAEERRKVLQDIYYEYQPFEHKERRLFRSYIDNKLSEKNVPKREE
jgi:hypothetical protein